MEFIRQDLRFALRQLIRTPGFALLTVVTLALGIGATTAIFAVFNAALLRPLPYPAADRLVSLWATLPGQPRLLGAILDFDAMRAQARTITDLGVIREQSVNITGGDTPDRITGAFVTANTLRLLGVRPERGRLILSGESASGSSGAVAVLSDAMWRTRFGGADLIGHTVILDGAPRVVIGIAAPYQSPWGPIDAWIPVSGAPAAATWLDRANRNVWAVAQLRAGVRVADAQREFSTIADRLAIAYPGTNAGLGVRLTPIREEIVGSSAPVLWMMLGSIAIVLLIACANIANLQLVRAARREREIAVRAALGARRGRLVRQLLTESLVLAGLGGIVGLVASTWLTGAIVALIPGGVPAIGAVTFDGRVFGFAAIVAVGTGLLFGAWPALRSTRSDLNRVLTVRGASGGRAATRNLLVGAQLTLCTVLLLGAATLARSLIAAEQTTVGFDPHHVLAGEFRLPQAKYPTPDVQRAFMARALDALRAIPGVESAALVRSAPLTGNFGQAGYRIPGTAPTAVPSSALENDISDGFFHTMRIPLLAGRDFTADDRPGSPLVAIVDQDFANHAWPGQSAIGKQIVILGPPDQVVTIVGLVGSIKQRGIGDLPMPELYQPLRQATGPFVSFVIRGAGDPTRRAPAVRSAIWSLDRDQPVWGIRSIDSFVDSNMAAPRFAFAVGGLFAMFAAILALIGVYGVMSYALTLRTRELGIRAALGAQGLQLVRLVLGEGAVIVVTAVLLGVAGALGASQLFRSLVAGAGQLDLMTIVGVSAGLIAVALGTAWIPVRRAARVDPIIAMRAE
ncbi:MAG TPA: ABC transporter permease [Gemmatimonadales bacterium]|jgi:putative ABC transport system permease protein